MKNEGKNLKVFGYGLGLILGFIGWRVSREHGLNFTVIVLWVVAAGFVLITSIDYRLLKPFYTQWMKVAGVLSKMITGFLLVVIFYTIFLITGIILRLLKKDFLNRAIDSSLPSYWIDRKDAVKKEDYQKQF